jgi:hypothetical protein
MSTKIPSIQNPSLVSIPSTSNLGTVPSQYSLPSTSNVKNNINNITGSISGSLNKLKSSIDNIKGKLDNNNIFKSVDQPSDFLKEQKNSLNQISQTAFSKDKVLAILTPIIIRFARVEYIANLLINKLTKQTKEQVKNKGKLIIQGGTFTFTPSNNDNYLVFKDNFDKKVKNIKKSLDTIQNILTLINNVIRVLNIALAILQIYLKVKLASLQAKLISVSADLASPSPSKASGPLFITLFNDVLKYEKTIKQVEKYQTVIRSAQLFLGLFKTALNDLRIRVNQLQFIITTSPNNAIPNNASDISSFNKSLNNIKTSAPETEEYVDAVGKAYVLKLVTLPNGFIQYQALDSFSKLKITQTAPSKTKTPDQLLEEIKQILG